MELRDGGREIGMRRKGIKRFFEVLVGEFRGLIKLNLLLCACVLPSVAIFLLGLFGVYSVVALVVSLLAAFPVGGAMSAFLFCVTRMLRDEPGYIWEDFKRKFAENKRQAAAPGILCAAFMYAQVYLWGPVLFGGAEINSIWLIPGIGLLLIFCMVTPYFFLQVAYIDLGTKKIIVNSVLISFSNAPRSFLGAITGGGIWIAFVLLLPESLVVAPVLLLFGFSVSLLLNMMWVWPPVNKLFKIEETLIERRELS